MPEKIETTEVRNLDGPATLTASKASYGTYLMAGDINKQPLFASLQKALDGDTRSAEDEINYMELEKPGAAVKIFATTDSSEMMRKAVAWRKHLAPLVAAAIDAPYVGSPAMNAVNNHFTKIMQPPLAASLVGDPIERVPTYQPLYPLVLKRTAPKGYAAARNGTDTLQYEDPIDVQEATNFDPQSGGGASVVISESGSSSTIYPYFKESPKHMLTFHEWSQRLIDVPMRMRRNVLQELDMSWDADVITHFDAVIPNSTLYSSHTTHSVTITNNAGQVSFDKFREGGRKLIHTDSTTGTAHMALPGFALCDILAYQDIEEWGGDVWTEDEVSEIAKNGFGIKYDGTVVTGKIVNRFALLQMPIGQVSHRNTRRVRFFGQPSQVGYFVPVTLNGKNLFTQVGPMSGRDPDWNQVRNVTTPPGFAFTVQAWQGGALQIANPYALARLNHS